MRLLGRVLSHDTMPRPVRGSRPGPRAAFGGPRIDLTAWGSWVFGRPMGVETALRGILVAVDSRAPREGRHDDRAAARPRLDGQPAAGQLDALAHAQDAQAGAAPRLG